MVSDDFVPAATGVGVHIQGVARALIDRGHRVSVVTSRRRGQPNFEIWHGIRIYRTFTLRVYGFYQALPSRSTVRRILDDGDFDIIHYHYLSILLMRTYAAARPLRLKHVYTYHMTVDHLVQPVLMKPLTPLIFWLHVRYCNSFDLILAPSANLLSRIQSYGIHTPTRFLSNPIAFNGTVEPVATQATFVVLYVGRLGPEKNLPYLLEAFARFRSATPDPELWIVGEGSQAPSLRRLARKLGVELHVRFFGFVPHQELGGYYAAADVFVLPSLLETQGMVAMEAMYFGKPIIVTSKIVSARELVDDGDNGFIVDPSSVADLVEKLTLLNRNTALRRRMGQQSLEKTKPHTPAFVASRLEGYYTELL